MNRLVRDAGEAAGRERGGAELLERELPRPGAALGRYLAGKAAVAVLGEVDRAPVGVALAALETLDSGRPLARVEMLYVEPEAREVGLGDSIMGFVARWAGEAGAGGIDAVVLPGMREMKNFLESAGFVARLIVMRRSASSAR